MLPSRASIFLLFDFHCRPSVCCFSLPDAAFAFQYFAISQMPDFPPPSSAFFQISLSPLLPLFRLRFTFLLIRLFLDDVI